MRLTLKKFIHPNSCNIWYLLPLLLFFINFFPFAAIRCFKHPIDLNIVLVRNLSELTTLAFVIGCWYICIAFNTFILFINLCISLILLHNICHHIMHLRFSLITRETLLFAREQWKAFFCKKLWLFLFVGWRPGETFLGCYNFLSKIYRLISFSLFIFAFGDREVAFPGKYYLIFMTVLPMLLRAGMRVNQLAIRWWPQYSLYLKFFRKHLLCCFFFNLSIKLCSSIIIILRIVRVWFVMMEDVVYLRI